MADAPKPTSTGTALTLVPAASATEWQRGLQRPGAVPFHAWEWLVWISPLIGQRFVPLVLRAGENVRGVVPLVVKARGPVRTANWVPFPYLGPVVDSDDLPSVLLLMRRWCRRNRVVDLQLGWHPTAEPPGATVLADLGAVGFTTQHDGTYIHRLAGQRIEEVWGAVARQRRGQIQRCLDLGMYVRPATERETRKDLIRVHQADLARHGVGMTYDRDLGDHLVDRPPRAQVSVRSACMADGTVVGIMATLGGDVSLCWLGGALPEHRDVDASALLYWDAISGAHQRGSSWIDLVGVPTPGIAQYKKRFGGQLCRYPVVHRSWLGYDYLRRWSASSGVR